MKPSRMRITTPATPLYPTLPVPPPFPVFGPKAIAQVMAFYNEAAKASTRVPQVYPGYVRWLAIPGAERQRLEALRLTLPPEAQASPVQFLHSARLNPKLNLLRQHVLTTQGLFMEEWLRRGQTWLVPSKSSRIRPRRPYKAVDAGLKLLYGWTDAGAVPTFWFNMSSYDDALTPASAILQLQAAIQDLWQKLHRGDSAPVAGAGKDPSDD